LLVVDASVVLKWLIADSNSEPDTDRAFQLMQYILADGAEVLQPPHWLAEVGAVLSRVSPSTAIRDVERLIALDLPVLGDSETYRRACSLAIELNQHVFDTLYHAVALETAGAVLVTADERYAKAAGGVGGLTRLATWTKPDPEPTSPSLRARSRST
jgi:predicted nucleic acid-binding protein